ncbi:MAG: hypothetical protein PHS44_03285 [Candidatus Dojkabacteria bacterium]|nr:hypothetical protein [Candidatus Dojkabacteria bacterium]
MKIRNSYKNGSRISLALAGFFFLGIFIPSVIGLDGFDGGFAISFLSFFLFLSTIAIAFLLYRTGKEQGRILEKKDILAHWIYSQQFWLKYAGEEYERDRRGKFFLFLTVAGWGVFFGVLFPLLDSEDGFIVTYAMFGLILLIGLVAFLSIRIAHRKNMQSLGEAYIAKTGVIMNGQVVLWNQPLTTLKEVTLSKEGAVGFLDFEVMSGRSIYNIRVPIPAGSEAEAKNIIKQFNSSLTG